MDSILISSKNKPEIESFIKNPSHALLLVGKYGYGKKTLAKYISSCLLNIKEIDKIELNPYYFLVEPENNLISIDQIRNLKKVFQLKTTGRNQIRRVIIIVNADSMNDESQNAILKILEEPPEDSLIIMTVSNESLLKPTVLSRAQKIKLLKPTKNEVIEYFNNKNIDDNKINKNYIFTNGAIGLISTLTDVNNQNEYDKYIQDAKDILNSILVDKLNKIDQLVKEKETIKYKLYCLKQIAKTALTQSINKKQEKLINYWLKVLNSIQNSEDQLDKGANSKLVLTNLFMHM